MQFPPKDPRSCAKTRTHCRHTFRANPFTRSKCVEEEKCIRGRCYHGSILRQPCRYFLTGTCTRTLCENWHAPECQFYKQNRVVSEETRACFLITRSMNNQIKAEERLLPKKKRQWRQRRCGHCEKCIAIELCLTRLGCTRFSRNERVSGKPDAESLERNSKSSIHLVHATSREYPGQGRTIALKNTSQTSTSAKSLRYKNSKISPTKRLKDKSDVPKARLGILPNISIYMYITSSKRMTKLHTTRLRTSGFSQMRQQESRRR